jgi:hypothetical protein
MTDIPYHATELRSDFAAYDRQVAKVLSDESGFVGTSVTAEPLPKAGEFRTIWRCLDRTIITHRHSWATGMACMARTATYANRFNQKLPSWAVPMPPVVIRRLCDVALRAGQPLPSACPEPEGVDKTFSRIVAISEGSVRFKAP